MVRGHGFGLFLLEIGQKRRRQKDSVLSFTFSFGKRLSQVEVSLCNPSRKLNQATLLARPLVSSLNRTATTIKFTSVLTENSCFLTTFRCWYHYIQFFRQCQAHIKKTALIIQGGLFHSKADFYSRCGRPTFMQRAFCLCTVHTILSSSSELHSFGYTSPFLMRPSSVSHTKKSYG